MENEENIRLAATSTLNYAQILFAEAINKGLSNKEAYANAYPQANDKTCESASSQLISLPKMKDYIYSLKAIQEDNKNDEGISRQLITDCRRSIITSTDPATKAADKLTACRDQAKMSGYDEPEKLEHSFKVVWGE